MGAKREDVNGFVDWIDGDKFVARVNFGSEELHLTAPLSSLSVEDRSDLQEGFYLAVKLPKAEGETLQIDVYRGTVTKEQQALAHAKAQQLLQRLNLV